MSGAIQLESRLDTAAAPALWSTLSARIGQDVTLDASAVEFIGARCLELILIARGLTLASDNSFSIRSLSGAVCDDLRVFGLTAEALTDGGAV